jgi:hypothetical protein
MWRDLDWPMWLPILTACASFARGPGQAISLDFANDHTTSYYFENIVEPKLKMSHSAHFEVRSLKLKTGMQWWRMSINLTGSITPLVQHPFVTLFPARLAIPC